MLDPSRFGPNLTGLVLGTLVISYQIKLENSKKSEARHDARVYNI